MRRVTRIAKHLWRDFAMFWDLRALLLSLEIETLLSPRLTTFFTHHPKRSTSHD